MSEITAKDYSTESIEISVLRRAFENVEPMLVHSM